MKVIGVGLPRTATLTQKAALEMLGLGPCYHMVDVIADMTRAEHWLSAERGEPDWETTFAGFQATVDWPGGYFYRELVEHYPEAKVVLSVRDPESWARSMRDTVWSVRHGDSVMRHLASAHCQINPLWARWMEMLDALLWTRQAPLREASEDPARLAELGERFNHEVREFVPADRLLVWSVGEGWGPLCEFLEVDVPSVPMPHLNDGETFVARIIDASLGRLNVWWERERPELPAPA